jgi:hypothetical protein
MSGEPTREVVVRATLDDTYDGMIRLLGDAQRFGFGLRALKLASETGEAALVTITLSVPTRIDAQVVVTRLARHPAVRSINAQGGEEEVSLAHLDPMAA